MKSNKLLIGLGLAITLVVGMGLALGGSVTASQEQEVAIKQFFLKVDEAWDTGDIETLLMCLSEDAQIMVGREKKIVSKEEYRKMLPSILEELESARQGPIKITLINKLSATVEREAVFYVRNHEVTCYIRSSS